MMREIWFRMTAARAEEIGAPSSREIALRPVMIDTNSLTPIAKWIAEHITATYIVDEYRDKIGISAFAGISMAERDRADWRYDVSEKFRERVEKMAEAYGDVYTSAPLMIDEITFPIYSSAYKRPEDVIEHTAHELKRSGAVKLRAANGDEIKIA